MARKQIIRIDDIPYHITARTNNKEFFPLPMTTCWRLYCYYLKKTVLKYSLHLHGFVLMGNHFHLICSTTQKNIDQAMGYFLTNTSKGISFAVERTNHLYGGPYKWKLLETPRAYTAMLKYLYRNPIRANLCLNVEDYSWSSLQKKIGIPIIQPQIFENEVPEGKEFLKWLNEPTQRDFELEIKKSLKRNGCWKSPRSNGGYQK